MLKVWRVQAVPLQKDDSLPPPALHLIQGKIANGVTIYAWVPPQNEGQIAMVRRRISFLVVAIQQDSILVLMWRVVAVSKVRNRPTCTLVISVVFIKPNGALFRRKLVENGVFIQDAFEGAVPAVRA